MCNGDLHNEIIQMLDKVKRTLECIMPCNNHGDESSYQ